MYVWCSFPSVPVGEGTADLLVRSDEVTASVAGITRPATSDVQDRSAMIEQHVDMFENMATIPDSNVTSFRLSILT